MLRIALALIFALASVTAYAQFNKCGPGFCPGGIFSGAGFSAPSGSIPPPSCSPGSATGEMDFSVCSNIAITAAVF